MSEGVVNYEKRKRDYQIETNKELASSLLKEIYHNIERPNKEIILEAEDYCDYMQIVSIPSNYYRELAYNLEHTIHHMALIRVGINEVSSVGCPMNLASLILPLNTVSNVHSKFYTVKRQIYHYFQSG